MDVAAKLTSSLAIIILFVAVLGRALSVVAEECSVYTTDGKQSLEVLVGRGRAPQLADYTRRVKSIEFDHKSGQTFGLVRVRGLFKLARLDPFSGNVDIIGRIRTSQKDFLSGLSGLAVDETQGKLYTYSEKDTVLWELKPGSGKAKRVFRTDIDGILDMASHPKNGLIYATTGKVLYRINQHLRRADRLIGGIDNLTSIWFAADGELHGITEEQSNNKASIRTINLSKGRVGPAISTIRLDKPLKGATSNCNNRMNVLMIAIDDMNDWVGHLGGHPNAYTPNIDKLARKGVAFRHAHAASSACLPSRIATLYGRYPTTTGIYKNGLDWLSVLKKETSLMELFKENGYDVVGTGKLFHGKGVEDDGYGPDFWTRYEDVADRHFHLDNLPNCTGEEIRHPECQHGVKKLCQAGLDFGPSTLCEQRKNDQQRASWIIERLQERRTKPVFMAVGFSKPHVPLVANQLYFDLFPLNKVKLPKTRENDLDDVPKKGQKLALDGEKLGKALHDEVVESKLWPEAVQAYLATVAYADAMVGRVMDAFDKSYYAENTIVVLWSDHGWHLGEKHHWRKGTLWEDCTRVPFIFHVPGITDHGTPSDHPVDLLSIFKTLTDLTELPLPNGVEGQSLVRLLKDPRAAPWDHPALIAYREHIGLRKDNMRYIRYEDGGEELYDIDEDMHEWQNLALFPARYNETLQAFRSLLPKNPAPPVTKKKRKRRNR